VSGLTTRWRIVTVSLCAALLLAAGALTVSATSHSPAEAGDATHAFPVPDIGDVAPRLELTNAADGAAVSVPAAGRVSLVSFLETQPSTSMTASRAQAVSLLSLDGQYHANGLSVMIVDASPGHPPQSDLTNTSFDWHLGSIPLLVDDKDAAGQFGISSAPSTILFAADGHVLAKWNGYVLTATVAQAISAALGIDFGGLPPTNQG